ncbi:pirin family protein [Povalibacter sp.]|uniref:pirin family protein n=1 Tax=Povalibacter sp. TaxID=1962978 RepID=UPI002F3F275B
MITVRKAEDRGTSRIGWLDSHHTFSFSDYHDPRHMGFRSLRVINDDTVAAGAGFGTHGHRDMEIITYVLDGALAHSDSIGTGSVIRPGDVQKMSAGSGIRHSEFNHSQTDPVHFLQIWIIPDRAGVQPGYQQLNFPRETKVGKLVLVASNEKREDLIHIEQDAKMYVTLLESSEQTVSHTLAAGRHAWIHVATGSVVVNGQTLRAGDGAAITDEATIEISGSPAGEVILFDLG